MRKGRQHCSMFLRLCQTSPCGSDRTLSIFNQPFLGHPACEDSWTVCFQTCIPLPVWFLVMNAKFQTCGPVAELFLVNLLLYITLHIIFLCSVFSLFAGSRYIRLWMLIWGVLKAWNPYFWQWTELLHRAYVCLPSLCFPSLLLNI